MLKRPAGRRLWRAMKNQCNKCATKNVIWPKRIIYNKPSSKQMERATKAAATTRQCYQKKKEEALERQCSICTRFVATCEESQQQHKWNVARSVILMRSPDPVSLAVQRRKCLKIAWKREKSNKYLHRSNQVNIHYWFVQTSEMQREIPTGKELINHPENWMKLCRQTFYNS